MLSQLAVATLLGLASAAPKGCDFPTQEGYDGTYQSPFKFPLSNGFPNPSSSQLKSIEVQAHGTLPNGALPSSISDAAATTLQVIAFNEIFEVAFFTSFLENVTSNAYKTPEGVPKYVVHNALKAVQGQEQLHALGANGILKSAGRPTVEPCEYMFPASDFDSAAKLAYTFTDVVLGTLQDAQRTFATDGQDADLVALVGSIIGQEGEQNGFYRAVTNHVPSALPFLTRSAGKFAYSALNQLFVVPNSCGNANVIDVPILPALTVVSVPKKDKDTTAKFSFTKTSSTPDVSKLSLVYVNQQNTPIVESLKNVQTNGNTVSFEADFPGKTNIMNGLTIAAITDSAGPFMDGEGVADAALYGPGLIEIR